MELCPKIPDLQMDQMQCYILTNSNLELVLFRQNHEQKQHMQIKSQMELAHILLN